MASRILLGIVIKAGVLRRGVEMVKQGFKAQDALF